MRDTSSAETKREAESIGLTIEAVLIHYGARTIPGGAGWRSMRCPFHDDGMASASVNHGLNAFKCHACGMSGDSAKIIERKEKLGFEAACEFARSVFGASVEQVSRTVPKQKPRRKLGSERWSAISS